MPEVFEAPVDELDAFEAPEDELDVFEAPSDELDVQESEQSRLSSGLSTLGKSFAKVGTQTIEGLGQLGQSYVKNLTPQGILTRMMPEQVSGPAMDLLTLPSRKVEELGASGTQKIEESLPTNPAYEDEWFASKIPNVIGQAGGQLVSSLIPAKWAGLGSKAIQALGLGQAGLLGLSSGYEEAERLGIKDPVKRDVLATLFGSIEAGSESLGGFGSKSFSKAMTGEIRDILEGTWWKTLGKAAVVEGLEEVAAKIPQDILSTTMRENEAEVDTINPLKAEYWGNLAEAWGLGAIAGGVFGGAQALANKKTTKSAMAMRAAVQDHVEEIQATQAAGQPLSEQEAAELAELTEYDARLSKWLEERKVTPELQQAGLATARAINSASRAGLDQAVETLRASVERVTANLRPAQQVEEPAQETTIPQPPPIPTQEVAPEPITQPPDATLPQLGPTGEIQTVGETGENLTGDSPSLGLGDGGQEIAEAPPSQEAPKVTTQALDEGFARAEAENPAQSQVIRESRKVLAPAIERWAGAFSNVSFQPLEGSGIAVAPDGTLLVDLPRVAQGLARGAWTPKSIEAAMSEEAVHPAVDRATARMIAEEAGTDETSITPAQINEQHAKDWISLPENVRKASERLYRASAIERASRELGKESLTEQEIEAVMARIVSSDSTRGAEFKRQVMQDRLWGVLTEEAQQNEAFADWLKKFLKQLIASIKNLSKTLTDPVALKRLDDLEVKVREELAKLGVKSVAETRQAPEPSDVEKLISNILVTPFSSARTGEPIKFNAYRGSGLKSGELVPKQQAEFGRKFLLGEGVYSAPSENLAGHFGDPKPITVVLTNPFVIEGANGQLLKRLDLEEVKSNGHDGIIIKSGQWGFGSGQEDLRQAVVFPEFSNQVLQGHSELDSSVLQKGLKVKILPLKGREEYLTKYRADELKLVGQTGTISSLGVGGNPRVKIGSKTYLLNKDEVEVIPQQAVSAEPRNAPEPITPEQDRAYLAALERGDMETAQRMVLSAISDSVRAKVSNLLGVTGEKLVDADVIASIRESEILDSVISSIPVDVMDDLGGKKRTTEMLLHDLTVPLDSLGVGQPNNLVVLLSSPISTDAARSTIAGIRAELANVGKTRLNGKMFAALDALQNRLSDGLVSSMSAASSEASTTAKSTPSSLGGRGLDVEGAVTEFTNLVHTADSTRSREQSQVRQDGRTKNPIAVTYDAQGQIIPLSKRFNPEQSDIRYAAEPISPEEAQARISQIVQTFQRRSVQEQEEGTEPTKATKQKRTLKVGGEPESEFREPISRAEMDATATELIDLAALQTGGKNKKLGEAIEQYLYNGTGIPGLPNDLNLRALIAVKLLSPDNDLLNQLGIERDEVRSSISQIRSQFGTGLGMFSKSIFNPLQELYDDVSESVDKQIKAKGGSSKKISQDAKEDFEKQKKEIAKQIDGKMGSASWFDEAMGAFSAQGQKWLARLKAIMQRVNEIDAAIAQKSAKSAAEPVGSEPAAVSEMSLEQLQAERVALLEEGEELLRNLFGTKKRKTKPKPDQVKKEIETTLEAAEKSKDVQTFRDWVAGAEQEGIDNFNDLIVENVRPGNFNREGFAESLKQKFQNVEDELVERVTNEIGDLIDAKEQTEEDGKTEEDKYQIRAMRIVGDAVAKDAQIIPQSKDGKDPLTELIKKRLKDEINAVQFMDGLANLDVEPMTAFALNRKVERDIQQRKEREFRRKQEAERKRIAAEEKRELEKYSKQSEGEIDKLSKELSDTLAAKKEKSENALRELMDDFMGKNGPSISEEMFVEKAKALNIPEAGARKLVSLLRENLRRSWLIARTKLQQRKDAETQREKDRITAEAERKIEGLSKQFSDTLPPKTDQKVLTGLRALIEDYSGKNGAPITDERFLDEAEKLGVDEGTRNRLMSILQESRRRDRLVALTKLDQAEQARLKKELEALDKPALSEINRLAEALSDIEKQKTPPSEFKKLVDKFKKFEATEQELRDGLAALKTSSPVLKKLVDLLILNRKRQMLYQYTVIRQNVEKARKDAIDRAVKALAKPTPKELPKRNKFINTLIRGLEDGVLDSDKVRDAFAEAYEFSGLTTERMEKLGSLMRQIDSMPDGIPKQTLMELAFDILNEIAPPSRVIDVLYQNLLGGVLGASSTMIAQFSGLSRAINPFQGPWQFMAQAGVNPLTNPKVFAKVWADYMKQAWKNAPSVLGAWEGLAGGRSYGVGVSPSNIAGVMPRASSVARSKPSELYKVKIGTSGLIKELLGDEPTTEFGKTLKNAVLMPSWLAGRSFHLIRGAEAWSGNVDKLKAFEAAMLNKLIEDGMKPNAAWNKVKEMTSAQTNKTMWDEAYAKTDQEIKDGDVSKFSRQQRAAEIVQDKLDQEFKINLKNRHREMSAWLNFKTAPLTFFGSWFAEDVMGRAPTLAKSLFLFSRFFSNMIERAVFNTPLGFINMSKERAALGSEGAKGERNKARLKRIEAIFGSLENYRQYRNGIASSSIVSTFVMSTVMALAWAFWKWSDDDEKDRPPPFWITGSTPPTSQYAVGRQLGASGWWAPNTLYLSIPGTDKRLTLNYVQGNPELAITMNAIGNVADRIMFPEMLNYKRDARTGEREKSLFRTYVQPFVNSLAAPASRSTYVTVQQAFSRALDGNPQSLVKLLSRPFGEATAATMLGGPVVRDIAKSAKPDTPKASQDWKQALASGIPFADAMGLTTGLPMLNQFGEDISPFAYFPFMSAEQESSERVKKAARILNDSGITKQGPKEWMMDADLVEIAHDGERYLLSMDERRRVLQQIGTEFSDALIQSKDRITGAPDYDAKSKIVQGLMMKSRDRVLRQWRSNLKRD